MTIRKSFSSGAHRDPCAFSGACASILSDLALKLIGSSDCHFIADDPVLVARGLAVPNGLKFLADTTIFILLIVAVVVLAFNSWGSLGALNNPDAGASASLLSDVASFALGSGGRGSEASELLVSTVALGLSSNSDEGNEDKLLKHLLF